MSDPDRALGIMHELRDLGVRLSVDDFGTGYSSMAYLKILPVDELKVDRSFVSQMNTSPDDTMLVQSAIDLGHNLGMSVVAEGVEDQQTCWPSRTSAPTSSRATTSAARWTSAAGQWRDRAARPPRSAATPPPPAPRRGTGRPTRRPTQARPHPPPRPGKGRDRKGVLPGTGSLPTQRRPRAGATT